MTLKFVCGPTIQLWAGPLLLGIAASALIAFGVAGVGHPKGEQSMIDLPYFYQAGKCWAHGQSPYDLNTFIRAGKGTTEVGEAGFAYPPQSSGLFLLLSLVPLGTARWVWIAVGVLSAGVLAWFCVAPGGSSGRSPPRSQAAAYLIAALVLGNPYPAHTLWNGASALLAAATLFSAWCVAQRGRWGAGGVLLGIATFKPQLALLPVLWFLFERRWKLLAVAGVTAAFLSLPAVRVSGVIGVFREWFSALHYASGHALYDGFQVELGIRRFLFAIGLSVPDLAALAVGASVLLWAIRSRITPEDRFPLLLGATTQFVYLHNADLVVVSPMIPAFWRHLRGRPTASLMAWTLLAAICFPRRLLRNTGVEWVAFIQIPALLVLVVWLAILSWKETRPHPAMDSRDIPGRLRTAPADEVSSVPGNPQDGNPAP